MGHTTVEGLALEALEARVLRRLFRDFNPQDAGGILQARVRAAVAKMTEEELRATEIVLG